jgi:hypothetical protein
MNFREHFEAWHLKKYGYVGKYKGTAMNIEYQTTACQQRWEGWQACGGWHTKQEVQVQIGLTDKQKKALIAEWRKPGGLLHGSFM